MCYFTIFQHHKDVDPEKIKMAVYNVLPGTRDVVDERDFYRPCWRIEARVQELPLLQTVGLRAEADFDLHGKETYCVCPIDTEDERYAYIARLVSTVDKSAVEKALGMSNWKTTNNFDYLECRLDKARHALEYRLDFWVNDQGNHYYIISEYM